MSDLDIRSFEGGVRFNVRVQPRAARTELAGTHGDAVKIRVAAPPLEGAANDALVGFLARHLGVAKSAVRIARGEKARRKVVEVAGIDAAEATRLLT